MSDILQIVENAFNDCGAGTNLFGQHRKAQSQFAGAACEFFSLIDDKEKTQVAIIEGSTGVGKSYAYLTPLICHSVINGKRVAIATFTRHLQHQLKEDIEVIIQKMASILPRSPTVAVRFGSDEYFNKESVRFYLDNPPDDEPAELAKLKHLFDWLSVCENEEHELFDINTHTGRYSDYLDQSNSVALPFDIDKSDVSIKPYHPSTEKTCYIRDVKRSKNSDVVVVTQAMLMLHIKTGAEILNDERAIDYLVIDEADKIGAAAESIFKSGFSLAVHHKHFETLANSSIHFHEVFEHYTQTLDYLADIAHDNPSNALAISKENSQHTEIIQSICRLEKSLTKTLSNTTAMKTVHYDSLQSLMSIHHELYWYINTINETSKSIAVPTITWSPVYASPSLVIAPINTGYLTAKLFGQTKDNAQFFKKILFTSATLSLTSDAIDFSAFKLMSGTSAAIKSKKATLLSEQVFKANGFGRISMILSPNSAPKPIYINESNEVKYDNSFLRRVLQFARLAIKLPALQDCGKRTLILTCSYDESYEIAKVLRAGGLTPIEHEQGFPLRDYVNQFRNDNSGILVTCAAWEGFDERVANLIISRIPFINLGHVQKQKINHFSSSGISEKVAVNIIQKQLRFDTQRKLAQGIGRIIRRNGDSGRLMFCDPRVKKSNNDKWSKTLGTKPVTRAYCIKDSLKCDYHVSAWKMATVLIDNEDGTIININGEAK
ncbi:hypothetical protein GCM10011607_12650 [Shewanella inventionis]|uniref:Helicase ATP-binding domain-containing protein n=1 Tax=Shewanella inventionis TaxID=1738770 RepID=A0ABQ1IVK8_9GAMM|nr:helicase C-terminal domain-containing protein [Shewanella inventionis]GGB53563.1 hypothetical protein GCM10011607_12650 [Shewanella inventionis]